MAETTVTSANPVEMLQPSLLFIILSKGWRGWGINGEGELITTSDCQMGGGGGLLERGLNRAFTSFIICTF